ncbi:MAG: tetratricopeptide repeat protein, partial [Candidatus Kapaibacterium sp.]
EDTSAILHPIFTGGSSGITGTFYHDEKIFSTGVMALPSAVQIDTSRFIYDDYPARARFYAGIALSRAGKTAEARDVLTNLSQDPTALYADKAWYHLALVEFKSGHSLQAEGLLAPIALHRSQSGVFASILLGDIHYRRSSFAKAAEYFGFALANLPDNDTILRAVASLERGLSLLPLGSWVESAQDLKLYLSLASGNTTGLDEALFWLGRAYFRSDSIPQARNCFKRVLGEFPNSTRTIDAQYGYAWTLFRNGEYKLADREFAKVIEMDSITRYAYDALSRRGDALYAGGEIKTALAIYNLAVDRPTFNDYRTTRSLYQLGVIRMRNDSARSAMNAFHTIITKFPKSDILDRSYYDYAVAAYAIKQEEKGDEAIHVLSTKFKDSPFASKGIYLSASEDEHTGENTDAYANYKKILTLYPNSEEFVPSLFGAVNALAALKRYDDAITLADSFFVRSPSSPYAPRLLFRKGEIEFLAAVPFDAKKTFEDFSIRFPNDTLLPMARYMLGKALSSSSK